MANMYTVLDERRASMGNQEAEVHNGGTHSSNEYRTSFRRDYARILHSPSFRRLQGKTQLFPCFESDFFRNRLTHSLEVAQIAKSIAIRINKTLIEPHGKGSEIDLDLVELASLAHDLGHPPFGHQGEEALNTLMRDFGGFEGNAQTLRILSKLEKKTQGGDLGKGGFDTDGSDRRFGLDLTYRSLASVLKYDARKTQATFKGYYASEESLVKEIKRHVLNGAKHTGKFKTIECQIMDIADDIAYSTFDIEDIFKSGFLNPIDLFAATPAFYEKISENVTNVLNKGLSERSASRVYVSVEDVYNIVSELFRELFDLDWINGVSALEDKQVRTEEYVFLGIQSAYRLGKLMSSNGYFRTGFTSKLINEAVNAVEFELNEEIPALSTVKLREDWNDIQNNMRLRIEIMKQVAFQSQILSPKLKVVEYRGKEIIRKLFEVFASIGKNDQKGYELLPDDVRLLYDRNNGDEAHKRRIVCDFIASMTDRYAIEFYGRITSENPETIFKPL